MDCWRPLSSQSTKSQREFVGKHVPFLGGGLLAPLVLASASLSSFVGWDTARRAMADSSRAVLLIHIARCRISQASSSFWNTDTNSWNSMDYTNEISAYICFCTRCFVCVCVRVRVHVWLRACVRTCVCVFFTTKVSTLNLFVKDKGSNCTCMEPIWKCQQYAQVDMVFHIHEKCGQSPTWC